MVSREAGHGWATCAVTQLGFVRLSSNPAYTASAVAPGQAATVLAELTSHEAHRFWDSPVASDATIYGKALGHQQVNDAYLVAVAEAREGRLVTLDQRLSVHATRKGAVFTITA